MGKKLTIGILLIAGAAYMLYVPLPDACNYPWQMKLVVGLVKTLERAGKLNVMLGGSFFTPFKLLDIRMTVNATGIVEIETEFDGVPVTIYRPQGFAKKTPGSAMIYFHGGGWTLGSVGSHSPQTVKLAQKTGLLVVVPEYRLAPEHPFPAAFEDCLKVTKEFLLKARDFDVNPKKIILAGDSAGGNLAVAVALELENQKKNKHNHICMTSLIYPSLQMSNLRLPSFLQNHDSPALSRELMARFVLSYAGLENHTELIPLLLRNNHMNGFKDPDVLSRTNEDWVPKKYKARPLVADNGDLLLPEDVVESFVAHGVKIQELVMDPKFAPLSANDAQLRRLPNTHIIACEYDVLRDDAIILHERMKHLGLRVSLDLWEFCAHGVFSSYGVTKYEELDKGVDRLLETIHRGLEEC